MNQRSTTREIQENEVLKAYINASKIKKINAQQMLDLFSVTPNYVAQVTQKVNNFIALAEKLIFLEEEKDSLETKIAKGVYPEEMLTYESRVQEINDTLESDPVDLIILFKAIGRFLVDAEYFKEFTQEQKMPEDVRNAFAEYMSSEEREKDEAIDVKAHRYAFLFMKELIGKYKDILPQSISPKRFFVFFSAYVYNEKDDLEFRKFMKQYVYKKEDGANPKKLQQKSNG